MIGRSIPAFASSASCRKYLAHMVGPSGHVVATDIDRPQLEIARREAEDKILPNIEFRYSDITADSIEERFDLVHARFILTHLADPAAAVRRMRATL
jgi:tRNA A58 N-methylase Trm61